MMKSFKSHKEYNDFKRQIWLHFISCCIWGLSCLLPDNLHWSLLPRSMSAIIKPSISQLLLLDVFVVVHIVLSIMSIENVCRCIKQSLSEFHQVIVFSRSRHVTKTMNLAWSALWWKKMLNVFDGLNTCIDSRWFKLNCLSHWFLWQAFVLI